MMVNGCDCTIVIGTEHFETDIPFSDETVRGAVSLMERQASIEGDGVRRVSGRVVGTTGCLISPLTIDTAPLLLGLALGSVEKSVQLSVAGDFYRHFLCLAPMEDAELFDIVQDRGGGEKVFYEGCEVEGFELRLSRGDAVKLRLDICGVFEPRPYPYKDRTERKDGERFNGDNVVYNVNGKENSGIYGLIVSSKRKGSLRTELWIKRALNAGPDIPQLIDELCLTAKLVRDRYDKRYFGTFKIRFNNLVRVADETNVNSADAVIGPVRYYVSGAVSAEVFGSREYVL